MNIPLRYVDGYENARKVDPGLAEGYIRHTTIGDPLADCVVAELAARAHPGQVHSIIRNAVEQRADLPKDTPESLRELIAEAGVVPDWFDRELAMAATRAFLRNSGIVMTALVSGAIVEGFATLVSKSFRVRGRITQNGVRRLKQNMLHLVEQFMPGGIEPGGDGWRLSVRIRLVHAQARLLIRDTSEWDSELEGVPLSAAHILLGSVAFSARMMHHVARLGGDFTDTERKGYVHVWRYTARLLGIPDAIGFTDQASAQRIFEVASMCEPQADDDAIIMANSIINSAPILLGFTDAKQRRFQAALLYRISRDLIGDELADRLRYPKSKPGIRPVPLLRCKHRVERKLRKLFPGWQAVSSWGQFAKLLKVSNLDNYEHSYSLPTTVFDEESRNW